MIGSKGYLHMAAPDENNAMSHCNLNHEPKMHYQVCMAYDVDLLTVLYIYHIIIDHQEPLVSD